MAAVKKPAAAVKKNPVKVLKFNAWEVSDFVGETIVFAAKDVKPNMSFNFFNCEKCDITIEGKSKTAMFSKCKKMNVKIEQTVSMVEIMKGTDSKFTILKSVPQLNVEHCNGIQVIGTAESKNSLNVVTTAS